jgi:hypothetical protein
VALWFEPQLLSRLPYAGSEVTEPEEEEGVVGAGSCSPEAAGAVAAGVVEVSETGVGVGDGWLVGDPLP